MEQNTKTVFAQKARETFFLALSCLKQHYLRSGGLLKDVSCLSSVVIINYPSICSMLRIIMIHNYNEIVCLIARIMISIIIA